MSNSNPQKRYHLRAVPPSAPRARALVQHGRGEAPAIGVDVAELLASLLLAMPRRPWAAVYAFLFRVTGASRALQATLSDLVRAAHDDPWFPGTRRKLRACLAALHRLGLIRVWNAHAESDRSGFFAEVVPPTRELLHAVLAVLERDGREHARTFEAPMRYPSAGTEVRSSECVRITVDGAAAGGQDQAPGGLIVGPSDRKEGPTSRRRRGLDVGPSPTSASIAPGGSAGSASSGTAGQVGPCGGLDGDGGPVGLVLVEEEGQDNKTTTSRRRVRAAARRLDRRKALRSLGLALPGDVPATTAAGGAKAEAKISVATWRAKVGVLPEIDELFGVNSLVIDPDGTVDVSASHEVAVEVVKALMRAKFKGRGPRQFQAVDGPIAVVRALRQLARLLSIRNDDCRMAALAKELMALLNPYATYGLRSEELAPCLAGLVVKVIERRGTRYEPSLSVRAMGRRKLDYVRAWHEAVRCGRVQTDDPCAFLGALAEPLVPPIGAEKSSSIPPSAAPADLPPAAESSVGELDAEFATLMPGIRHRYDAVHGEGAFEQLDEEARFDEVLGRSAWARRATLTKE